MINPVNVLTKPNLFIITYRGIKTSETGIPIPATKPINIKLLPLNFILLSTYAAGAEAIRMPATAQKVIMILFLKYKANFAEFQALM